MGEPAVVYAGATPADRPALVELLQAGRLPTSDLPASLGHFFVARAGGRLVGAIGLEVRGSRGLLRSLAIAPEHQGQGLAHRLWHLALGRLRALELSEVFLLTTTAEPVFAHWGFTRISREQTPEEIRQTEEFRSLCPASAAVMRLAVPGPHECLRPSPGL